LLYFYCRFCSGQANLPTLCTLAVKQSKVIWFYFTAFRQIMWNYVELCHAPVLVVLIKCVVNFRKVILFLWSHNWVLSKKKQTVEENQVSLPSLERLGQPRTRWKKFSSELYVFGIPLIQDQKLLVLDRWMSGFFSPLLNESQLQNLTCTCK